MNNESLMKQRDLISTALVGMTRILDGLSPKTRLVLRAVMLIYLGMLEIVH